MWACREAECVVACVWMRYLKTWKEKGNHHKGNERTKVKHLTPGGVPPKVKAGRDSSPTLAHASTGKRCRRASRGYKQIMKHRKNK